jgi:hypothetical protein
VLVGGGGECGLGLEEVEQVGERHEPRVVEGGSIHGSSFVLFDSYDRWFCCLLAHGLIRDGVPWSLEKRFEVLQDCRKHDYKIDYRFQLKIIGLQETQNVKA